MTATITSGTSEETNPLSGLAVAQSDPAGHKKAAATGGKQPEDTFRADGAIDIARVKLFRGPLGVLRCTVEGEKTVLRAKVVRVFPLSHHSKWINVLDGKNKEVCLIEDPDLLDPQSRQLAYEEIERQYRHSTIQHIYSISNEYRTLYWDVQTDRGRREFAMKWAADTILWIGSSELMLVDIDTNRFLIQDVTRLDPQSRKALDIIM